jgi:hypothetical protein
MMTGLSITTTRMRLAGIALVLLSVGIIAAKFLDQHHAAEYCVDAGFGPGKRFDAALGRCVEIEDPLHYSPYAYAVDGVFAAASMGVLIGLVIIFRGPDFWPFTVFRRRGHERAYAAAKAVVLGYYGYQRLSAEDQRRVDANIKTQLHRADSQAVLHYWMWDAAGALRAVAMARLGLAPAAAGETWDTLLERWPPNVFDKVESSDSVAWGTHDRRAFRIMMDFHYFHPATEAAKADMRRAGLAIPDIDPPIEADVPEQLTLQEAGKGRARLARAPQDPRP